MSSKYKFRSWLKTWLRVRIRRKHSGRKMSTLASRTRNRNRSSCSSRRPTLTWTRSRKESRPFARRCWTSRRPSWPSCRRNSRKSSGSRTSTRISRPKYTSKIMRSRCWTKSWRPTQTPSNSKSRGTYSSICGRRWPCMKGSWSWSPTRVLPRLKAWRSRLKTIRGARKTTSSMSRLKDNKRTRMRLRLKSS